MPRKEGRKGAKGRQRGGSDGDEERADYSTRAQVKNLEALLAEKEEEVRMANAAREAAERQVDVSRRTSPAHWRVRSPESPSRPRRNSSACVQTATSSSSLTARNPFNRRPPPWWSSPRRVETSPADRSGKFAVRHAECRSRPLSESERSEWSGPRTISDSSGARRNSPHIAAGYDAMCESPFRADQTGLPVGSQDQNQAL